MFALYANCHSSQRALSLTTTDSLQTIELLMRSDGQMDRHREGSYRVLSDSAGVGVEVGQTHFFQDRLEFPDFLSDYPHGGMVREVLFQNRE